MNAVTKQEIVEALREHGWSYEDWAEKNELADRIEQHGIAPPGGMVFVPEEPSFAMREAGNGALDKLKSDSTMQSADKAFYVYHAMLDAVEGQFTEQADEETHRRVDEAVRDGRIVDKRMPDWPIGILNRAKTLEVLTKHNEWRRGASGPQTDPRILGLALDAAIAYIAAAPEVKP